MNIKQQFASLMDLHMTAIVVVIAVTACASDAQAQPGGDTGINDVLVTTENEAPDGNGTFSTFGFPALNDNGQVAFYATFENTSGGTDDDTGICRASLSGVTRIEREFNNSIISLNDLSLDPAIDNNGRVLYTASFKPFDGAFRPEIRFTDGTAPDPTVAYGGQAVPGGNGLFDWFSSISLSRNGHITFRAYLDFTSGGTSDNQGLYQVIGTTRREIARIGQAAPDGLGGSFWNFPQFAVNDNGAVSFAAILSYTTNDNAVYKWESGNLDTLLRKGEAVPGSGEMDYYSGSTSINNSGSVAYTCTLQNTHGGEFDDSALYRQNGSYPTEIIREGDPAPDGNGVHTFYTGVSAALNAPGQIAFDASLRDTNNGFDDNQGIFITSGNTVTQIVRKGQPAPDGNGTVSSFYAPALNDSGVVAYRVTFTGTTGGDNDNTGIYLSDGVETVQVARDGDLLNGSAITELYLHHGTGAAGPTQSGLNNSSQVAYEAVLAGGSEAIVLYTPDLHWRTGTSGSWSNNANWTLSLAPAELYDTYIAPESGVVVSGPSGNTTVKSLFVGAETSGRAVLDLSGGGDLAVVGAVTVGQGGEIRVGTGRVLAASVLSNGGVVSGDGQIDAYLSNLADGEIRVGNGQRLCMSGDAMEGHGNMGKIEVLGGEIEFDGMLINAPGAGLIAGEDATFRFNGGVFNQGSIALSYGTSRLFGDVTNIGTISIGGGAGVTFYDDIVQIGDFVVSKVGGTVSTAVVFGDFTGGGGHTGGGDLFLLGDLRPGNSPAEVTFDGNVFLGSSTVTQMELGGTVVDDDYDKITVTGEISLAGTLDVVLIGGFEPEYGNTFDLFDGTISGTFDEETYPALEAGLQWNDADLYTTGTLSVVYDPSTDGDIDQDGDVDSSDLNLLLSGIDTPPSTLDLANLDALLSNFGRTDMGGETVPEPAAWLLLWLGLCCFVGKRHIARE